MGLLVVSVCIVIVAKVIVDAAVALIDKLVDDIASSKSQIFDEEEQDTSNAPEPPDVTYPGDDPSVSPGEDYTWHGKADEPIGGDKGAWVNEKTGEQWHPDLNHKLPKGPHWDYTDIFGLVWSVFKDGRIIIW